MIHEGGVWNFRLADIRISNKVSRTWHALISSWIGSQEIAVVSPVRWDNCCAERRDSRSSLKTKMDAEVEFDFSAIQLKRRGSHVPSIFRARKFLRFDGTLISEREKSHRDSMRFASSLKVGMPASASNTKSMMEKRKKWWMVKWGRSKSREKIDYSLKLQIIWQLNLSLGWNFLLMIWKLLLSNVLFQVCHSSIIIHANLVMYYFKYVLSFTR